MLATVVQVPIDSKSIQPSLPRETQTSNSDNHGVYSGNVSRADFLSKEEHFAFEGENNEGTMENVENEKGNCQLHFTQNYSTALLPSKEIKASQQHHHDIQVSNDVLKFDSAAADYKTRGEKKNNCYGSIESEDNDNDNDNSVGTPPTTLYYPRNTSTMIPGSMNLISPHGGYSSDTSKICSTNSTPTGPILYSAIGSLEVTSTSLNKRLLMGNSKFKEFSQRKIEIAPSITAAQFLPFPPNNSNNKPQESRKKYVPTLNTQQNDGTIIDNSNSNTITGSILRTKTAPLDGQKKEQNEKVKGLSRKHKSESALSNFIKEEERDQNLYDDYGNGLEASLREFQSVQEEKERNTPQKEEKKSVSIDAESIELKKTNRRKKKKKKLTSKRKPKQVELFRPSCDAYTPRMGKRKIRFKPAEKRTPVLERMATTMGTLSRPNFRDALRRVAMIIHQHIVKIEQRFENAHNRQQRGIHRGNNSTKSKINNEGLFKESMKDQFSEHNFATPLYKSTVVRLPMSRPGIICGQRKVRERYSIPSEKSIYEFAHQLFQSVQLSSECSIVCLIYVERLMEIGKVPLLATTWRPIFMCGLLLASKVWQDLSSWNIEFASVYPRFSLDAINKLELLFLKVVKWDLYISSSLYAKYYFALRSLVEKPDFRHRYNRMVGGVGNSEALKIQKRTEQVKEEALLQMSRSM